MHSDLNKLPVTVVQAGYTAANWTIKRRLPDAYHFAATYVVLIVVAVVPRRRATLLHLGVNQFSLVDGIMPTLCKKKIAEKKLIARKKKSAHVCDMVSLKSYKMRSLLWQAPAIEWRHKLDMNYLCLGTLQRKCCHWHFEFVKIDGKKDVLLYLDD